MSEKKNLSTTSTNITFKQIEPIDHPACEEILKKYLPDQVDSFYDFYEEYATFYLGAFIGTKLVGLAFGFPLGLMDPLQKEYFLLDGIAVDESLRSKGIGSRLLSKWEDIVFNHQDLHKIGLGTVGIKACCFYINNNYNAYGYLFDTDEESFNSELICNHHLYLRHRIYDGQVYIYLEGNSFDENEKDLLKAELLIDPVIVLFEKTSKP